MNSGQTLVDMSQPRAELAMVRGPWPGYRFPLSRPSLTLGRGQDNDLVVAEPQVSSHHASLIWDGSHWILQDLGSANGTYVNNVRVTGPKVLQTGDLLALGPNVLFGFQAQPAATAPWPLPGPSAATGPGGQVPSAVPAYATATTASSPLPPTPAGADHPAPAVQAIRPKGRRRILLPLLVVASLFVCLLAVAAGGYYLLGSTDSGLPSVLIESPRQQDQIEVGREVAVHSIARGDGDVTRVELWVDGELHEVQATNIQGGVSPLPLLAYWQPVSAGNHTLTARAFSASGGRSQASITLEATEPADRDGDGISDGTDLCPDETGSIAANGCPDQDLDGIPDASDACPNEFGMAEHDGCPGPAEGDRDGDNIPDDVDGCPDEAGVLVTEGCADTDGDGIRDAVDACPAEPGSASAPAGAGCPAPAAGDGDGDGIADANDACLGQAGSMWAMGCPDRDGDGVHDGQDSSPGSPGPAWNNGSPAPGGNDDRDQDGVPDRDDECPNDWGLAQYGGCNDSDGDGFPNNEDRDPDNPGPANRGGAPSTGANDTDGDGLDDDLDACDDEPGLPEHDGCPPPSSGSAAEGGIPPVEIGPPVPEPGLGPVEIGPLVEDVNLVEFQALEFETSDPQEIDYLEICCYASLAGADEEQYCFQPGNQSQWRITPELSSQILQVPIGENMGLRAQCEGHYEIVFGAGSENLGSLQRQHPPDDWQNFREFEEQARGDGGWFRIRYRLCAGSCEGASGFPPPRTSLGGDVLDRMALNWEWDGDTSAIDGFKLYADGNFIDTYSPDANSALVWQWQPPCGGSIGFQVSAYRGSPSAPEQESALSQITTWERPPCQRLVRVTFETLETGNLPREGRLHTLGPISAEYGAWGSGDVALVQYHEEYPWGYNLSAHNTSGIQGIFPGIPNFVTVGLDSGDALNVYGTLWDWDSRNDSERIFRGRDEIAYEDVAPGRHTIRDNGIALTYSIELLPVPGAEEQAPRVPVVSYLTRLIAGASVNRPDLTISGVYTSDGGQLQIQVWNRGRGDLVDAEIGVAVESTGSGGDTTLSQRTVTASIAADESIMLNLDGLQAPSGARIVLDPQDNIDETREDNNDYRMPVRMRVQFLRAEAPFCNESDDPPLDPQAEQVFQVAVGHGPSGSAPDWLPAQRFPDSGMLRACRREGCIGSGDPAWNLTPGHQYRIDLDVPANENLFVLVTGYEHDLDSAHDSLGQVFGSYAPTDNWGDAPEPYESWYGRPTTCDEPGCVPCQQGLFARWRITRLY